MTLEEIKRSVGGLTGDQRTELADYLLGRLDSSGSDGGDDCRKELARPSPQRVRIVGTLRTLQPDTRSFGVVLDDGREIQGVLADTESIAPLLNQRVLALGTAVCRPSGQLLRVDAESVTASGDTGSFFSTIPKPHRKIFDLSETIREQQHKGGIAAIFGRWPGDETDEQVEAALRELS